MKSEPVRSDECDELRLYWLDYEEKSLPAEMSQRIAEHLEWCGACSREFAAEARIARKIREAPVPAFPGLLERFEEQIRAALATGSRPEIIRMPSERKAESLGREGTVAPRRLPLWRYRMHAALAAAAVLLISLIGHWLDDVKPSLAQIGNDPPLEGVNARRKTRRTGSMSS